MRITDDQIIEGLLIADKLLNIRRIYFNDLREICEQCVYIIYGEKL